MSGAGPGPDGLASATLAGAERFAILAVDGPREGLGSIVAALADAGYDVRRVADVDAALAVVWQTALPEGLWQGGYVFDAAVLLYPRTVGAFDPATAEWVALVNSGWLE